MKFHFAPEPKRYDAYETGREEAATRERLQQWAGGRLQTRALAPDAADAGQRDLSYSADVQQRVRYSAGATGGSRGDCGLCGRRGLVREFQRLLERPGGLHLRSAHPRQLAREALAVPRLTAHSTALAQLRVAPEGPRPHGLRAGVDSDFSYLYMYSYCVNYR